MIKSKFLRRLFYNWHIKLISLILAFILWKYVDSLNERERYLNIDLVVKNIPNGYIIVNKIPAYIKLIIKGKEENLAILDPSDFKAYIDLGEYPQLPAGLPVKINKMNIPRRIVIKDINPATVSVKLERIKEKNVKVVPVIIGKPKKGYLVEDILINPGTVKITGPSSVIKSMNAIYTKEIDITNARLTASSKVSLIIKPHSKIKIIGDNHVNVIIKIVEKFEIIQIDDVELKYLNLKKNFSITPEKVFVNVKLRIPVSLSNVISKKNISVFVDCKDIEEVGNFVLPVQVESLMKDIDILGYEPESIEFGVRRAAK